MHNRIHAQRSRLLCAWPCEFTSGVLLVCRTKVSQVIQIRNETEKPANDSGLGTVLLKKVTETVTTMDDSTDKWFLIVNTDTNKAQCL